MIWKYAGRYVLPFSPSNMKMDIRWNTALADTISSVRTRSLSKEYPQFTVNYSTLLKGAGLQFATDRVLRDLDQEVLIPMWQDVATERISDTEVAVLTDKTFYREGMLVILWASDTEWQIVEVEQVNPNYVKFGVNNTDWVCVAPIEEGFMAASPSTSTDRNRNTKLDYSVVIKRLDGPLSTTGGGVIPGVYVNSFIGNGVDSYMILSNDDSINLGGVHVAFNFEVKTVNGGQYLNGTSSGGTFTTSIATRVMSDGRVRAIMDGVTRNFVYSSILVNDNQRHNVSIVATNDDIIIIVDDVVDTNLDIVSMGDLVSIYPVSDFYLGRFPTSTVSMFDGEISELYWSTNPLAIDKATIIQYATGKEMFTQIAPDVVPTSVNSFIGNGVDSSVVAPPLLTVPSFIGMHVIYKHTDELPGNYCLQQLGPGIADADRFAMLYTRLGDRIGFYANNSIASEAWTTLPLLVVGVTYSIQIGYSVGGNPLLYIDGLPIAMTTFYSNLPVTPITVAPILNTIGGGFTDEEIKGELWDSYWSTNPDFILLSSVTKYAEDPNPQEDNRPFYTGKELFTQIAPDALVGDWIGGAVQGEIKEGWLGGAVQGEVEVSPPSGGPPGPYPEDPKLTRTPIQSTKANSYSLHLNTIKSVGGVLKVNSMRSVPTVTTTHTWDNQSRAEYLDMLDFAARCRGRKNAFDTASFKCDLIPIAEGVIGNGYLDVLDPGLQSLTLQGTRFTVIRGSSWDSSEVYEILSLENVTGGVRLVLDKAIAVTIFTTDAVSNIRQSRLASDVLSVEIDSFNRSSSSIAVRDINEGG